MIRGWFDYVPRGRRGYLARFEVSCALNGWTFGRMSEVTLDVIATSQVSTTDYRCGALAELERRRSL